MIAGFTTVTAYVTEDRRIYHCYRRFSRWSPDLHQDSRPLSTVSRPVDEAKSQVLYQQERFCYWPNVPVHIPAIVHDWSMASIYIFRRILHRWTSSCSRQLRRSWLASALTQETFQRSWEEGIVRTIAEEGFATVSIRWWYKQCKKCFRIGGKYVKKR